MATFHLTTPVAFFIYKRPDATRRSFKQIKKAEPKTLFIIADGAKNPDEELAVEETRSILSEIDWDCQVFTNMSDVNLGCKQRFFTGLEWLFSNCEEAIIIEDDIIVSSSFFEYAQELLDYYREDKRVFSISGCNIGFPSKKTNESYSFSNFMNMWGWATWRRAYNSIDFEMKQWSSFRSSDRFERSMLMDRKGKWNKYWTKKFDDVSNGDTDTWDYQWIYSQLLNNGVSLVPSTNMISNIGYGEIATHTANNERLERANLTAKEMNFPLTHPKKIKINKKYERFIIRKWCHVKIPTVYENIKSMLAYGFNNLILSPTRGIRGKLGLRQCQIDARRNKK